MVAGADPRRVREREWYVQLPGVLPRRWVVELSVGEPHVDGDPVSGGRWLGWSWASSARVCGAKLEWGLDSGRCQGATLESWAAEEFSPERTLLEPEADGVGRSWGRRALRGYSRGWARSREMVEVCGLKNELGGALYSRPEAVAVNGISPASDYGDAVAGRRV